MSALVHLSEGGWITFGAIVFTFILSAYVWWDYKRICRRDEVRHQRRADRLLADFAAEESRRAERRVIGDCREPSQRKRAA